MSGNSPDDKNDLNYQQELSRFLHTGCSKLTSCQIMIVEKPNLILEVRYCGKLVLWEIILLKRIGYIFLHSGM